MTDPTIIPWGCCWAGLLIVVSGGVLALHGIGQRRPSSVEKVGLAGVTLGFVLLIAPLLVNGTVMLMRAVSDVAVATAAAARPAVPPDRSPDR